MPNENAQQDGQMSVEQSHYRRNYAFFWILGFINNFHYCLVLSAAANIAESYDLKKYVALISWANVFGGVFFRLLNAFAFAHVSYNWRFLATGLQTLLGIILVCVSPYIGSNNVVRFSTALLGVFFCGNGSSYGESAALGYLGRFPGGLVGAWSAGTGMSGVLASLAYLGLAATGLSNSAIFFASVPLVFVYWGAYYAGISVVVTQPSAEISSGESSSLLTAPTNAGELRCEENPLSIPQSPATVVVVASNNWTATPWTSTASRAPHVSLWQSLSRAWPAIRALHRLVAYNSVNLMLVYIAEYAAQLTAPFAFPCSFVKGGRFLLVNSYVITQLCYQLGVLCSRSSLACVRIRRVEILTAIQCVNAVAWFIQSKTLVVSASEDDGATEEKLAMILFSYMFFVGLLGGASYVNVFYNIREELVLRPSTETTEETMQIQSSDANESDRLPEASEVEKQQRELAMNIGALYAVAGITIGSMLDVILTNTLIDRSC
jgi:battenin